MKCHVAIRGEPNYIFKTIWIGSLFYAKVHIFGKGHKIFRNLHQLFVLCTASQIIGGDFTKFCGLLRIYEPYIGTKVGF